MKGKFKHTVAIIFSILFASSFFASENIFWNISTYNDSLGLFSKKNRFKEYKGPFPSLDSAIAFWIYENIPEDDFYAITSFKINDEGNYENQELASKNPSSSYEKRFSEIKKEFDDNRYNVMSRYRIVPNQKIEQEFSKKNKKYFKILHPREYFFDLYDFSKEISFSADENGNLTALIDFTKSCENDLPQKNDRITVYLCGKTKDDFSQIDFSLFTKSSSNGNEESGKKNQDLMLGEQTLIQEIKPNEFFSNSISFDATDNCESQIYLKISVKEKNDSAKSDKKNLKLKKIVDSTNTFTEAENEKNAVQKKYKIIEVKNAILMEEIAKNAEKNLNSDAEKSDGKNPDGKESEQNEENAENSISGQEEEKALQEKNRIQLEMELKQKAEVEKALAEATKQNGLNRNQREYLQDFETPDENYLTYNRKTENKPKVFIENPDEIDAAGRTLLMKAAKSGNDWQIKNLIESGANVNLQDKDGWTALMYAVRYQENLSPISLLIMNGADVYMENNFKTTALTIATCYNNNPDILSQLLKSYEASNKDVLKSLTMLFVSSQPSEFIQLAKLDAFIQKAVPINTFYEGKTPLMYACQYGNSTRIIKVLLDNNAAVTLRSSEGKTAFDYAAKNMNLEHDDIYWSLNRKR